MEKERHFVLVHGACHGAWCWYKVAALLKSMGHRVTALDLAASGIHPKQVHEVYSMSDYFEPLMEFMASLPLDEKVILVGHSMGGISISAAMERFPEKVSVSVFAAASMPGPDLSYTSIAEPIFKDIMDPTMENQFTFDSGPENRPTSLVFSPKYLSSKLYQLSPPEDLMLANLLVRPVPLVPDASTLLEDMLTKERYGSVRRVYIIVDEDYAITEEQQRWMIAKNPTDDTKLISGSDHMLMFSKPKELCCCLQEIAAKYP